ncbi:cell division/cell wall cluster transcriptional repressor MraZ [Candidatus Desantisbacteria bacterium CG07_land_8_20_14_0_80_39_15]|uniref:Transcriptional regulator MraZ n=1 Tax=Candidatus Desantisbacteria bacterium CG07_land_8_20_14_0_80_39_15 TaxID=1974549 RepID=A0A2M6ZGU7_9BACT|nr:MAG: cell division/cell wall cluster transcriptional repressor MraZ [Candidatus Desantisbacteria bacterium CG07_land_8_20_14_0_80_39_15]
MFMGEYQHSLDKKGRLIVPSKFREILTEKYEDKFVITRGLDNCLFLYPSDEWREIERKVKTLSMLKREARAFKRFLISGAVECVLDKQGRIMIPFNLRQHAHIERDVVLIGAVEKIEIWSKENWHTYSKKAEESFEEIAQELGEFQI